MDLSAPKQVTWWIGVILGVLGILGHFAKIQYVTANDFWFLAAGLVVLVLGTLLEGL